MSSRKKPLQKAKKAHDCCDAERKQSYSQRWLEAAGMLVFILAAYMLLQTTGLFSLSSHVEGAASLGAVMVIGLIAASSTCLAVVGGLLLSVSAGWAKSHAGASKWQKLRPMLLFNVGRLCGYFLLGGAVGLLGQSIALTTQATGYVTIALAIVMLLLGLNILHLVPKKFCSLPTGLKKRVSGLSSSKNPLAPLLLGALTFFLPCGFTQSMQFLALASGSFLKGGLIMLAFAIGTLPALLGISLMSSLSQGRFARVFLTFSGTVALILGMLNLQNGLLLTGIDAHSLIQRTITSVSGTGIAEATDDPYVSIAPDGRQIVTVYVTNEGYKPQNFTIAPGKETWIYAVAKGTLSGCANVMVAPTYNLSTIIQKGANWLGPVKNPQSDFVITCSMGMLRADIHVKKS